MYVSADDEVRFIEFNRVMEWANENKDTWDRFIGALGDDTALNDETYIKIIAEFQEKQFYQLLFVMFHCRNYNVREAVERATLEVLSKKTSKRALDDFIKTVITNLEVMKKKHYSKTI